MSCPICTKPIPLNTLFTCPTCWWKLPAQDRAALGSLNRRKVPTAAKLASVVRNFKAKQEGGK